MVVVVGIVFVVVLDINYMVFVPLYVHLACARSRVLLVDGGWAVCEPVFVSNQT